MSGVRVKVTGRYVILYTSHPDPASGRSDHTDVARLVLDEAEGLIEDIQQALPELRKVEKKMNEDALKSAQQALQDAEGKVDSLKRRMTELDQEKKRFNRRTKSGGFIRKKSGPDLHNRYKVKKPVSLPKVTIQDKKQ